MQEPFKAVYDHLTWLVKCSKGKDTKPSKSPAARVGSRGPLSIQLYPPSIYAYTCAFLLCDNSVAASSHSFWLSPYTVLGKRCVVLSVH